MKCLNCQKEVNQTEGKREKKYCSDSCRVAFFQKSKKNGGISSKYVLKESYERLFEQNQQILANVVELESENKELKAKLSSIASNKPQGGVKIQNLNKPTGTKEVPVNEPKTNYTIDTTEISRKIEELTKAANSCQDTKLGRLAKAGYLKQKAELEKQLK